MPLYIAICRTKEGELFPTLYDYEVAVDESILSVRGFVGSDPITAIESLCRGSEEFDSAMTSLLTAACQLYWEVRTQQMCLNMERSYAKVTANT